MTGRSPLRLANGRELSALDVQREYLAAARDFAPGKATDERVLGLWERVLGSVEAGRLDGVAREIDWVAKYQLIERYQAAQGLPLSAPQVAGRRAGPRLSRRQSRQGPLLPAAAQRRRRASRPGHRHLRGQNRPASARPLPASGPISLLAGDLRSRA
jgi:hypothetical protein